MADANEQHLAPIRDLVKKFLSSEKHDKSRCTEDLIKLTAKAAFYMVNTFKIALDALSKLPKINDDRVEEMLKLLLQLFEREQTHKSNLLTYIYNFSIKPEHSSPQLAENLFKFVKLTEAPEAKMTKNYLICTEFWTSQKHIMESKANRDVLYTNYRILMNNCTDKNIQQILFSYLKSTFKRSFKDWRLEFLTEVVYQGFNTCTKLKIDADEIFSEYVDFISLLSAYCKEDSDLLCQIIKSAGKCLTSRDHVLFNTILHKLLQVLSKDQITHCMLKDCKMYLKEIAPLSKTALCHKIALVLARVLRTTYVNMELNAKCYKSCHELIYDFFNILKYVKNEKSKNFECCEDIKRHELLGLALVMISYGLSMAEKNIFNEDVTHYFKYHIDYAFVIFKQLKCQSQYQNMLRFTTNALNGLVAHASKNLDFIAQLYKRYICLQETQDNSIDIPQAAYFGYKLTEDIDKNLTSDNAQTYADLFLIPTLLSLKLDDSYHKYKLILVLRLQMSVKLISSDSLINYVKEKALNSEIEKYAKDVSLEELPILEIETLSRYGQKQLDDIVKVFKYIVENVTDMDHIARTCISITDKQIKCIDLQTFKELNARLEKHHLKNIASIKIKLALASNYYFISLIEGGMLESIVNSTGKDLQNDIPECINLENELKIVGYMDKFLTYMTEVIIKLKEDPNELKQFLSVKIFLVMLENVSTQYFVRGIANKDLETKLILWHFLEHRNDAEHIVDTASFFLDNFNRLRTSSGSYLNISKQLGHVRIEEVITKANKSLETLLQGINEKSETVQARVLNYLLSLGCHHMVMGRKADTGKAWEQYVLVEKMAQLKNMLYVKLIQAKKLVIQAEISIKCYKRNAVDFLYNAIIALKQITVIHTDFSNIFQFLYRSLVLKVINYSLNRLVDVEYFSNAMLTIKHQAVKKGLFVKTLEMFSLSVLRNLTMEKLDDAKKDLMKMSKMLRLNDEILIEWPLSKKPTIYVPTFPNEEMTVRKAVSNHVPRKSSIEIFNDSRNENNELIDQLQKFVHQYNCKCSVCKYPQIKFIIFQMGCHYSRLLFLMNKLDISKSFNEYAMEPWQQSCQKILRTKDCVPFGIDKMVFIHFSIRWLFQVADTLVLAKDYSSIEEVYTEVELLCTSNLDDYDCIKQGLNVRMQGLDLLIRHGNDFTKANDRRQLDFNEFLKIRNLKPVPSATKKVTKAVESIPTVVITPKSNELAVKKVSKSAPQLTRLQPKTSKTNLVESVIYIDSDSDRENEKEKPKKTVKAPVKTTRSTRAKPVEKEAVVATPKSSARLKRCL